MTPVTQTLTLDRAALNADEPDTLYEEVSDPSVARAAQHLIVRHRLGQRFEIEALDVPHAALASIGEQLEEAGLSHSLADPFIDALRRYIMKNGGAFSRAANAKPVRVHMIVADRMPKSRFDNAMTELACLGPREVKVEGATRVNVRATPSGTATSSNAADVDAMFAQVRGLFLWVRFEAPTKEDLDGLMNSVEATLAGVAQSVGGAMGAADFKKLLEILQKDGAITPDITALVGKLIKLQEMAGKDGKIALPAAELGALLKEIGALMDKGQGLIPPALAEAVMRSMAEMSAAHPMIAEFLSERGFSPLLADNDNVSVEERLDAIMEKVAALATLDGLDPALAAELAEILQKAQADLKTGEITPAALLDSLSEKLTAMAARGDIPQALMDGIGAVLPEIAALRDSPEVASAMPDLAQGEALLAMLEEIAAKIEKGEVDINALPPEMKALIEKMGGVEVLMQKEGREARIEALAEALATKQSTELSIAVQAAIVTMTQPDAILALPAPVQAIVENFVAQNPAVIERAAPHIAAPMADIAVPKTPEQKSDAGPVVAKDGIAPLDVVVGLAAVAPVAPAAPSAAAGPSAALPSVDAPPASVSPPAPAPATAPPPPPPAPTPVDALPPAPPRPAEPPAPTKGPDTLKGPDTFPPPQQPPVSPPPVHVIVEQMKPGLLALVEKLGAPKNGEVQIKTPDKTAAALIMQAIKDLEALEKTGPIRADQAQPIIQKLVDAAAQATTPQEKEAIKEQIKALQNRVADPQNLPRETPATPKPPCHPICKCGPWGEVNNAQDIDKVLGPDVAGRDGVTAETSREYLESSKRAVATLAESSISSADTSTQAHNDETNNAIEELENDMLKGTGHIHGPNCNCKENFKKFSATGVDDIPETNPHLSPAEEKMQVLKDEGVSTAKAEALTFNP